MASKHPARKMGYYFLCPFTLCLVVVACALFLLSKSRAVVSSQSSAHTPSQQSGRRSPVPVTASTNSASSQQRARAAFGSIPLAFEVNEGQVDPQVKYLARAHGYTLFLTGDEAIFALPVETQSSQLISRGMSASEILRARHTQKKNMDTAPAVVHMRMLGANPQPVVVAEDQQSAKTNYIIGNDPRHWHRNISQYSRVHYRDVYPGIDTVYHGTQQLEFDFLVNPGADAGRIELGFRGTQSMTVDGSGSLVLTSKAGHMRLIRPFAYQEANGVRNPVAARFVVKGRNEVAFALGPYDQRRQLVIDPSISFSTFFGGPQQETGLGVAVDGSGNAYVVGTSNSSTLPGSPTTIPPAGVFDCYLVEFSPSGAVVFTTIFGGSLNDFPQAVAVDSTGIYVVGETQSNADFPVTPGAAQTKFGGATGTNGDGDGFVVKLKSDGSAIQWATYLGGNDLDIAFALAVDSSQNVFVAGETFSTSGFPIPNALPKGNAPNGGGDGFVTEIKADGSAFLTSSYIGGTNLDLATGIAWNATTGNVYITGETQSPNLPTTTGAFQKTCGTDTNCNENSAGNFLDDAFVAAFNPTAPPPLTYAYFTYLGGGAVDDGLAITTDSSGNAYITGKTESAKFPTIPNPVPLQATLPGQQSAFVTVLNHLGTALVYSTYLGGTGSDKGLGIALDANNNVYVTGQTTSSTEFPLANPTQENFGGGNSAQFNSDAFLSEVTSNGTALSLPFSTYIGGSGDEDILGGFVAVSSTGTVYVVGDTNSTDMPIQASSGGTLADSSLNGGQGSTPMCSVMDQQTQTEVSVVCPDAFVAAFTPNTSGLAVNFAGGGTGTVTSSPSGINCPGAGTCSASYANNTQVTLTAAATNNSTFAGWGGACSGTATCAVTLNANQFVTANFTPPTQLTVVLAGSGQGTVTSSPSGVNCTSTCTVGFVTGTTVTLTATPATDSTFAGWSGACSGTGTCSVPLTAAATATATFNAVPQSFTVAGTAFSPASISAGGSATSTLTVASSGGFNSSVTFTCAITPVVSPAPTCSASSITPPADGQITTTLTVSTTGPTAALRPAVSSHSGPWYAIWLPVTGLALVGAGLGGGQGRRKKALALVLLCLALSGVLLLVACGSSGSHSGGGGGTPSGSYQVVVTGTAGSLSAKASTLTVTVQ